MPGRWRLLLSLAVLQMFAAAATQGFGAWGPYLQSRLALSNAELGALGSIAWGVTIPGLFVSGCLLDRWGERPTVTMGVGLLVAGMILLAQANDVAQASAAMLLMGLGYSPVQPGGSKALHRSFPARERGLAMGLRQAALPLGGAAAAAVLPGLIQSCGWGIAMLSVSSLIAAAGGFFVAVHRGMTRPGAVDATSSDARQRPASEPSNRTPLTSIALLGMALVAAQTALSVFWALFLVHAHGMLLEQALGQLLQMMLAGVCGRVVIAAWSDRAGTSRARVVRFTAVAVAALMAVAGSVPLSAPGWWFAALSWAIGFFGFGWYGAWVAWITEEARPERIGRVLARAMAANQCAISVVPVLVGVVTNAPGGYTTAWAGFCALLVVTLMVDAAVRRWSPSG